MRRTPIAIVAVALLVGAVAACGDVVQGFARELKPSTSLETPGPARAEDAVVALVRPSVLKVRAMANRCRKVLEGTGFVVGPNRVLTNAHVVAGGESVTVEVDGTRIDAQVVSYNPNADIAIIDVPGLSAQPLSLAGTPVQSGTEALVLGYPGAGPFVAIPARIRETTQLEGPNIYRTTKVTRLVYIITMAERSTRAVSGSPLIDMNGRVLGVVFGNQVQQPDVGFALTSIEIAAHIPATGATQPVETGACIS
jgi:S1-C subfamily serine protease